MNKYNDLKLQLEQEQQKFKEKKQRYRDTLKLIDEKHAKGICLRFVQTIKSICCYDCEVTCICAV